MSKKRRNFPLKFLSSLDKAQLACKKYYMQDKLNYLKNCKHSVCQVFLSLVGEVLQPLERWVARSTGCSVYRREVSVNKLQWSCEVVACERREVTVGPRCYSKIARACVLLLNRKQGYKWLNAECQSCEYWCDIMVVFQKIFGRKCCI